jgi:hypothetical protein
VLVSEGVPGLFGVDGKADLLYFDGTFYERRDQKWFSSASAGSGWEEISSQKIPATVRSNYHKSPGSAGGKKKGGGKGEKAGGKKSGKDGAGNKAGSRKKQGDGGAKKHRAADEESEDEE